MMLIWTSEIYCFSIWKSLFHIFIIIIIILYYIIIIIIIININIIFFNARKHEACRLKIDVGLWSFVSEVTHM